MSTPDPTPLTLPDFLLARIAEDEEVAQAATHQKIAGPSHGNWNVDSALLMANGMLERVDRLHIARHDPARVLAECEAKRQIVAIATEATRMVDSSPADHRAASDAESILRTLALSYVDHGDYREEWRL